MPAKKIVKSKEEVQIKLLKDVVGHVVGPEAAGIVDLLSGKKNVNEFTIAEKLKITINQTRNILYKLSDEGLVTFVRKKDKKNGGWYTYFWTLETGKSIESLRAMTSARIKVLEIELKNRMHERYYHCITCDLESSEEDALQNFFACIECGGVLELKDNSEFIERLKRERDKLRKDLEVVEEQHNIILKKETATISRKARAEERKKKVEREKKKKERDAIKAKLTGKKTTTKNSKPLKGKKTASKKRK